MVRLRSVLSIVTKFRSECIEISGEAKGGDA